LLHGLRLASSLTDIGLDRVHRLATLAGFNVGVERGQFIFLAAVLALLWSVRRILRPAGAPLPPRLPAATAAVLGTIMLARRLA
jgi:hypothetical protein